MDDQLAHDHEDLGRLLGDACAALEAGDITGTHARLDLFWARLAMHIRAEHLHLFPAIIGAVAEKQNVYSAAAPSLTEARETIGSLLCDHDFFMRELSESIAILRELLTSVEHRSRIEELEKLRTRLFTVEKRLANHNLIEESRVYPWAQKALSGAARSDLDARVENELKNLPPRFTNADTN